MSKTSIAQELISSSISLAKKLNQITFSPPVAYTYNPLDYAFSAYEKYLLLYGNSQKETLFLGMNPGPFGMTQTGIPFGEIQVVKNWLKIEKRIKKTRIQHPKKPVLGFSTQRSEVSGKRLWGLFQKEFSSPEAFFQSHFVLNFCPLLWLEEGGKNLTPEKLRKTETLEVFALCQENLKKTVEILNPKNLIAVGNFAEKQFLQLLQIMGKEKFRLIKILHPSPASPSANKNWAEKTKKKLIEERIW